MSEITLDGLQQGVLFVAMLFVTVAGYLCGRIDGKQKWAAPTRKNVTRR